MAIEGSIVILEDLGTDGTGELKLIHASKGFFIIDYSDLEEGPNSVTIELEDADGTAEQTFSIENMTSLLGKIEVNNPFSGTYSVGDSGTPKILDILDQI